MVASSYVPHRGDLVWIDIDPQVGHEQAGRRPALVLSDKLYNARASLAIIVPITSRDKGYPFQVALPANALPKPSWVIANQVSSLDWRVRNAELIRSAPAAIVVEVCALAVGLVEGRR